MRTTYCGLVSEALKYIISMGVVAPNPVARRIQPEHLK